MHKFPVLALFLLPAFAGAAGWTITPNATTPTQLDFYYTPTGGSMSQYAALNETSAYLRMVYAPTSGWGTSVDLMPCFWSGGALYQGYPIALTTSIVGANAVVKMTGTDHGLTTNLTLTLRPPADNDFSALVSATTSGKITLDTDRPHEAFKPVFLSSMHDSSTVWDSEYPWALPTYPTSGWVFGPNVGMFTTEMVLLGGSSSWKTNAPTMEILFPSQVEVAGYVTADTNPNDDNVGFWEATTTVPASWSYEIICTD